MKKAALAIALLLFFPRAAQVLQAQVVHNGSAFGKTTYALDGSDYPDLSGQCHWMAPGFTDMAHVHVEQWPPQYAESTGGRFTVRAKITLRQMPGRVIAVWGNGVEDIVWDDTGSSTYPDMIGDPGVDPKTGFGIVKSWMATVTYDPIAGDQQGLPMPPHGWWIPDLRVRVAFDNGDMFREALNRFSIWSNIDPSAPITQLSSTGPDEAGFRIASCTPGSPNDTITDTAGQKTESVNGSGVVEFPDQVEVGKLLFQPQSVLSTIHGRPYNYGFTNCNEWHQRVFVNRDLHHNIPGFMLEDRFIRRNDSGFESYTAIDPAVLAAVPVPATLGLPAHVATLTFEWSANSGAGCSVPEPPGLFTVQAGEMMAAIGTLRVMLDPSVEPVTVLPAAVIVDMTANPTPQNPNPPPPPPPPPPPTALTCTGTVSGTSTNGGATVTVTGGSISCS
jgi:hypothetical protein